MILYGNFTAREVGRSETASRNGIDNTPTESVLAAAQHNEDKQMFDKRSLFKRQHAPRHVPAGRSWSNL